MSTDAFSTNLADYASILGRFDNEDIERST